MADFDISIYSCRISNILERTLARIKNVTVIRGLVNNYDKLGSILPKEVLEQLSDLKGAFINEDSREPTKQAYQKILENMLTYLERNKEILEHAESYLGLQLSPECEVFVKCLTELRNCVMAHQEENILQERAREERLRMCRLKNEHAAKEIAALEKELIEKKSDFNASIIGKNLLVNRHQNKIERIRKVTQEAIDWRATECETAIAADKISSEETLEELKRELEDCTAKYDKVLKENLCTEKELRLRRSKLEDRLAEWMQTFDQDMRERQAEEERLQAALEQEKKRYDAIQKKLDEKEEEYDELMQEKAAYEQQLVEQKLFLFILNRSARRIQRAWRAYKLRKMVKKAKKGKKGKGKK